MSEKSDKYLKDVDANTCDTKEVVIPNGEKWKIGLFKGRANPTRDTHVKLVWDFGGAGEEILALAHTADQDDIGRILTGDGTKILAICLVNDTADVETIGASYYARTTE